jgi:hypothetical protein
MHLPSSVNSNLDAIPYLAVPMLDIFFLFFEFSFFRFTMHDKLLVNKFKALKGCYKYEILDYSKVTHMPTFP